MTGDLLYKALRFLFSAEKNQEFLAEAFFYILTAAVSFTTVVQKGLIFHPTKQEITSGKPDSVKQKCLFKMSVKNSKNWLLKGFAMWKCT